MVDLARWVPLKQFGLFIYSKPQPPRARPDNKTCLPFPYPYPHPQPFSWVEIPTAKFTLTGSPTLCSELESLDWRPTRVPILEIVQFETAQRVKPEKEKLKSQKERQNNNSNSNSLL